MELADMQDLGSCAIGVQVRPLLPAPLKNHNKSTRQIVVLYAFWARMSL